MSDGTTSNDRLTVFYDGSCPLCVKEIGVLRRLDKRDRIAFEDVAPADADPSCPIDRQTLMARFHARLPDGRMVDGARAFTAAWSRIPWMVWLRPVGVFPPTRWILNGVYAVFLKLRPALQRWMRKREARS